MEPKTFWTTLLAWACCSAVWFLSVTFGGWWIVAPAIVLVCLSFTVALVQDVQRL